MSKRTQKIVLAALAVILAFALYQGFAGPKASVLPVFNAAETTFEPLKVEDPELRMDLLDKVRKAEYSGEHHDIFSFGPKKPAPEQKALEAKLEETHVRPFVGPQKPPPPEPPQIPVAFFGYATNPTTQNRLAFFSKEDDVFILGEGGMLMNKFRLVKIGNSSAEFEDVGTGLHATLAITQPDAQQAAAMAQQSGPPTQQP